MGSITYAKSTAFVGGGMSSRSVEAGDSSGRLGSGVENGFEGLNGMEAKALRRRSV